LEGIKAMTDASREIVDELLAQLDSKDVTERKTARAELVKIGHAAVRQLLDALGGPRQHVRWEAAKSLAEIADPSAAERLVAALEDKDTDVRWVVGDALIALGQNAVKPLLTKLTESKPAEGVFEGAHHVLHDLAQNADLASRLEPVLKAYKASEPDIAVPLAAAKALQSGAA
jgi:HEAT repeat protein